MVKLQGYGLVSMPAKPMNAGGQKMECDLVIDYGKDKPLQLISKDKLIRDSMISLELDNKVYFEGQLKSDEPGLYYVTLTKIEKVSKST